MLKIFSTKRFKITILQIKGTYQRKDHYRLASCTSQCTCNFAFLTLHQVTNTVYRQPTHTECLDDLKDTETYCYTLRKKLNNKITIIG